MSAKVADHCIVYALSDKSDSSWRQQCDHSHDEVCYQCKNLNDVLETVSRVTSDTTFADEDQRDEAIYIASSSTLAIDLWKSHLLRSVRQDQARIDLIENLDSTSVVIVSDWAMKFLPQRYRESQTDWFGKRGISWHIAVVYRRAGDALQWQAFVHIIQSCSQGNAAVALIFQHFLSTLKQEYPEIGTAYLRQDNASCYHSAPTIFACEKITSSTGLAIKRMDYSDPQGGKGAADRLAATCKAHIRCYINEGHDVLTSTDMREALLSSGGINGVRVTALEVLPEFPEDKQKIPGITKLNNFEFTGNNITAWRAYGIGQGKKVKSQPANSELNLFVILFCEVILSE